MSRRKYVSTTIILLALLWLTGCSKEYRYQSIWTDVYDEIPSYQDKLEDLEAD